MSGPVEPCRSKCPLFLQLPLFVLSPESRHTDQTGIQQKESHVFRHRGGIQHVLGVPSVQCLDIQHPDGTDVRPNKRTRLTSGVIARGMSFPSSSPTLLSGNKKRRDCGIFIMTCKHTDHSVFFLNPTPRAKRPIPRRRIVSGSGTAATRARSAMLRSASLK